MTRKTTAPMRFLSLVFVMSALVSGFGGHAPGLSSIFDQDDWNVLFPMSLKEPCPGKDVLTYDNFLKAASYYPKFANEGSNEVRKRELAAFLAQISIDSSGFWSGQDYVWGLCFPEQQSCSYALCNDTQYAANGKSFHPRGVIQISYEYEYDPVSWALGNASILHNDPARMADGVTAFRIAFFRWMESNVIFKPTSHSVMTGTNKEECACNRANGFGLTTNILFGYWECNGPVTERGNTRVMYYKQYADFFGVSYGLVPGGNPQLTCTNQQSYVGGPCPETHGVTSVCDAPPDYRLVLNARCGTSREQATEYCTRVCQSKLDCAGGQVCYSGLPGACELLPQLEAPAAPAALDSPTALLGEASRCGVYFIIATKTCGPCKANSDCSAGQQCFSGLPEASCSRFDACAGVTCGSDKECHYGECYCTGQGTLGECVSLACNGLDCGAGHINTYYTKHTSYIFT